MAEAVAVVSGISAFVQIIDFSSTIFIRLKEYKDLVGELPNYLKDVDTQLPLICKTLDRIKMQTERGTLPKETQDIVYSVVNGCRSQIELLLQKIDKVIPISSSKRERMKKASLSLFYDRDIQAHLKTLEQYMRTLTMHVSVGSDAPHTASQPQFTPSKVKMHVPFKRDPDFIGRTEILAEVDRRIKERGQVALAGIGGVGKSQIAIEYCYRFREQFPDSWIFWIYAASATRFEQAYRSIATAAAIPGWDDPKTDIFNLVANWFKDSDRSSKWLLVLDNADDSETFFGSSNGHLVKYIPRNGSLLVTTRDMRVGQKLTDREQAMGVSELSVEETKMLLESKIHDCNIWDDEIATELLEALEYLPLAVTQAAAFISENQMTIAAYLQRIKLAESELQEYLSEELEDSRRDLQGQNSVMRTWKISFEQISRQNPRAAEILSMMAVLDRQGIPGILLQKKRRNYCFR
ncbi:hypothetical protein L228DRAFT_271392 [Xylona heveae TC161]|uniref:NACHT-NTPase and P-loop NTPases N-terminal domain-containing protein n=1 Tax=Xylona heveae (strain CBS 132557 / TC161) TaxID=1328760 RepID=A0A164ZIA2_XYLHT|nr:hypothetical protein L228DRAFT_271392 [Xylona heveae TC161]KZF19132.1 hypothetical protein L228DRAFT_271392 [Xylona heveae TC161]